MAETSIKYKCIIRKLGLSLCKVLYPYPYPLYPSRLMNGSLTKPVLTTKRAGVYLNSSIAMFSPLTVVSVCIYNNAGGSFVGS